LMVPSKTTEFGVAVQVLPPSVDPLSPHEWAPVQLEPGTRMRFVAPAARMAEIVALASVNHCSVDMSWGSFMIPKITLELVLYFVARRLQAS